MNRKSDYNCYLGGFDYEWKNPPKPFNPDYDPKAKDRRAEVTASMERDNFYAEHTREECKHEWRRRYDALSRRDKAAQQGNNNQNGDT